MSLGKRKWPEEDLKQKFANKRRKIEIQSEEADKLMTKIEENSDLSEGEELHYNIEDFLAPQEKELLRKDPFNYNFAVTPWTNELTLVKETSEFRRRWFGDWTQSGVFPADIYSAIISSCESVDTLFKWRRVCKLTNAIVIQMDQSWRRHFYSRHWKLRHDLENNFFGVDPTDEDTSDWINVIPDNEVDWFGEYRRNHINAVATKKAVDDITTKLQKIVDEYGVVCEGVERPMFFGPGLTDEQIDTIAEKHTLTVTNDMRSLFKCCNGALFTLKEFEAREDVYLEVAPIVFPSLDEFEEGMSYARFEKTDMDGYLSQTSDVPSDHDLHQPLGPPIDPDDPDIPDSPVKIELTASDMASDGDDYVTSDQADSYEESGASEEEEEDDEFSEVFGEHTKMTSFSGNVYDDDDATEHLIHPDDGAVIAATRNTSIVDFVVFSSIIEYLQRVSDLLDSPFAHFWLEFSHYNLLNCYTAVTDEEQWSEYEEQLIKAEKGLEIFNWNTLMFDITQKFNSEGRYIPPRVLNMLIAAAQDHVIQIFKHASTLETAEELQLGTFTRAAKELFPFEKSVDRQ